MLIVFVTEHQQTLTIHPLYIPQRLLCILVLDMTVMLLVYVSVHTCIIMYELFILQRADGENLAKMTLKRAVSEYAIKNFVAFNV